MLASVIFCFCYYVELFKFGLTCPDGLGECHNTLILGAAKEVDLLEREMFGDPKRARSSG